jgi:hypothetical protein
MNKIILTGGKQTGLSSVWKGFKNLHPELHYVDDPMQAVNLDENLAKRKNPNHKLSTSKKDPVAFGGLVIIKSLRQLQETNSLDPVPETVILHRSLVDTYGREMANNRNILLDRLENAISVSKFNFGIFLDPDYKNIDAIPKKIIQVNGMVEHAYGNFGINLVHIPYSTDDGERIELVEKAVDRHLHEQS